MSTEQESGESSAFRCANPTCRRAWPVAVAFCPYCGRRDDPAARASSNPSSPAKDPPAPQPLPPSPPTPARDLTQGANAPIGSDRVEVVLTWRTPSTQFEVDASAFLLAPSGRVRSDADMIFFNQPQAEDGAVMLADQASGSTVFALALHGLSVDTVRAVFCVSIGEALAKAQSCGELTPVTIEVGPVGGPVELRYAPDLSGASEAALILGELYRRGEGWRFRAVGQGFAGGLAPLARAFGVEVED